MEKTRTIITAIVMCLAAVTPAFAVDTAKTYSSGLLVLVFLGFCALVVVAQLIPALMTMIGMLRGVVSEKDTEAVKANNH